MANKADSFYFNNFVESAQIACEAAQMLKSVLSSFNPNTLEKTREKLHEIEHKGDSKRHEMTSALSGPSLRP